MVNKVASPILSIGLPVYNGEDYLGLALDSLLAQTFNDFELIISDNASTDGTRDICECYSKKDDRIRYYRSDTNLGMHRNWNRVFELSSGKYFKWAAHDDLYTPRFLEKCVDVLDHDESVVLCYSRTKIINETGQFVRDYDVFLKTDSSKPYDRFYNMLAVDHWCFPIFGVIRSDILKDTPLHGYYFGSDRALLAELCLHGRVCEIPEYMFLRRDHPNASTSFANLNHWERLISFNPTKSSQATYLGPRRIYEYTASIHRSPLTCTDRLLAYLILLRLIVEKVWRRVINTKSLFLSEQK
jgi:glycosyltransferase involved in cell wall biosynthesis